MGVKIGLSCKGRTQAEGVRGCGVGKIIWARGWKQPEAKGECKHIGLVKSKRMNWPELIRRTEGEERCI